MIEYSGWCVDKIQFVLNKLQMKKEYNAWPVSTIQLWEKLKSIHLKNDMDKSVILSSNMYHDLFDSTIRAKCLCTPFSDFNKAKFECSLSIFLSKEASELIQLVTFIRVEGRILNTKLCTDHVLYCEKGKRWKNLSTYRRSTYNITSFWWKF